MDLIRDEINSIMREMEFPTLDEAQASVDQKWANFAVALAEQRKRHGPPEARQLTTARRGQCSYSSHILTPPRVLHGSGGAIGGTDLPWPYMIRAELADRKRAREEAEAAMRAEVESLGL